MRIYGYARVSSKDQNLDRQIVELTKSVDVKYISTDKQSGKDNKNKLIYIYPIEKIEEIR